MPTFDVVSEVDLQEVDNAVNQTSREIGQRYDFKGTDSTIEWDKKEEIKITADDDYKLGAIKDILATKLIKRNIDLSTIDYGPEVDISGSRKQQIGKVQMGIDKEKGKEIVKAIKNMKIKVQAQIMDDKVRVSGKKIDHLQEVISELKSKKFGISLQYINMRS